MTRERASRPGPERAALEVALYDYGAGNLHSLGKALEGAGATVRITSDWEGALAAEALVLPGVGAFGQAASALPADRTALRTALEGGLPCLGICLGMQLFFEHSDESDGHGIGLIDGAVRKLEAEVVPHMGWNDVEIADDPIFRGIEDLVAYYANSYVCEPVDRSVALGWSRYDDSRFVAAVRKSNAWGVQFHPEKSSVDGRRIIANFVSEARRIVGGATRDVSGPTRDPGAATRDVDDGRGKAADAPDTPRPTGGAG
jgi:glutamine amidotransferase